MNVIKSITNLESGSVQMMHKVLKNGADHGGKITNHPQKNKNKKNMQYIYTIISLQLPGDNILSLYQLINPLLANKDEREGIKSYMSLSPS